MMKEQLTELDQNNSSEFIYLSCGYEKFYQHGHKKHPT